MARILPAENLALRQQLLALHTKRPRRRLAALHKMFWVVLRRLWAGWKQPLLWVTPRDNDPRSRRNSNDLRYSANVHWSRALHAHSHRYLSSQLWAKRARAA